MSVTTHHSDGQKRCMDRQELMDMYCLFLRSFLTEKPSFQGWLELNWLFFLGNEGIRSKCWETNRQILIYLPIKWPPTLTGCRLAATAAAFRPAFGYITAVRWREERSQAAGTGRRSRTSWCWCSCCCCCYDDDPAAGEELLRVSVCVGFSSPYRSCVIIGADHCVCECVVEKLLRNRHAR